MGLARLGPSHKIDDTLNAIKKYRFHEIISLSNNTLRKNRLESPASIPAPTAVQLQAPGSNSLHIRESLVCYIRHIFHYILITYKF